MKNKLTKITSGFVFAVVTATICAPSATATPAPEAPAPGSSFVSQNAANQTATFASTATKTLSDLPSDKFSATIVLNATSGPQVIDATDSNQNLSDLLKSHGFKTSDFRSSDDTALDENYKLKNSENLSLFRSEASGESSVVSLPAPEVRKDSADLYQGEEKVENEGKDGSALRTVITKKNLAADSNVNAAAKATNAEASSEEKLTILTAPEPKVIIVGTKERAPDPVRITTPGEVTSPATTQATAPAPGAPAEPNPVAQAPKAAPAPPASNSSNSSLVNLVKAQVGKSYVWGAAGPNSFDCSGLVQWIFKDNFGYDIPRTAYAQGLAGTPINPADIQPGDIIYTPSHIAIYVGDGMIVHASSPATGVGTGELKHYLASGYKISRL